MKGCKEVTSPKEKLKLKHSQKRFHYGIQALTYKPHTLTYSNAKVLIFHAAIAICKLS